MTPLPRRVVDALDRFNSAHPWDHNAHYHRWILRQLPRRFGSALDVGCGTGDLAWRLAGRLAGRAGVVRGVDIDPRIVTEARALTSPAAPVVFTTANAPTNLPSGSYGVVTCVAAVHHLPFVDALTAFRRCLAPGGTLVVLGLSRPATPTDFLLGAMASPLNAAIGWLTHKGRAARRPVAMTAATRPAEMTFPDIVREARTVLPGARLRRRLFWRYTLVWRNR